MGATEKIVINYLFLLRNIRQSPSNAGLDGLRLRHNTFNDLGEIAERFWARFDA
jgi:hypothetical protein